MIIDFVLNGHWVIAFMCSVALSVSLPRFMDACDEAEKEFIKLRKAYDERG